MRLSRFGLSGFFRIGQPSESGYLPGQVGYNRERTDTGAQRPVVREADFELPRVNTDVFTRLSKHNLQIKYDKPGQPQQLFGQRLFPELPVFGKENLAIQVTPLGKIRPMTGSQRPQQAAELLLINLPVGIHIAVARRPFGDTSREWHYAQLVTGSGVRIYEGDGIVAAYLGQSRNAPVWRYIGRQFELIEERK
ncbi:MAG: hypothetical protein WCP97_04870 [bacterium]